MKSNIEAKNSTEQVFQDMEVALEISQLRNPKIEKQASDKAKIEQISKVEQIVRNLVKFADFCGEHNMQTMEAMTDLLIETIVEEAK